MSRGENEISIQKYQNGMNDIIIERNLYRRIRGGKRRERGEKDRGEWETAQVNQRVCIQWLHNYYS